MNDNWIMVLILVIVFGGGMWFATWSNNSQRHSEISDLQYNDVYRIYQTSEGTRAEILQILKTGSINQIQYNQIITDSDVGSGGRITLKKISNQGHIDTVLKDKQ